METKTHPTYDTYYAIIEDPSHPARGAGRTPAEAQAEAKEWFTRLYGRRGRGWPPNSLELVNISKTAYDAIRRGDDDAWRLGDAVPPGFEKAQFQYNVEDFRDESGPNQLGRVQVAVAIDFGGGLQHEILMQNEDDGVLALCWDADHEKTYEEILADSGVNLETEDIDNPHERLSAILDRVGVTKGAQKAFDEYLAEREPKITEEIYRPGAAFGGYEYRACLTEDGEVAVQSRALVDEEFRSHGPLDRAKWNEFEAKLGDDSGNPAYIAQLCAVLDDPRCTQRELTAALSPRDSLDIER